MEDGVVIAVTRYTPDGTAPAGGWPGVVVLHGLAGTRGSVDPISSQFAAAGYAVLAYDARGHGASGGEVTLAGPREVADLRLLRNMFARRPEVHDTRIGAWGISYGGGQVWNALAAGVPFAAAEVVETWTSLYDALWPQNLARSGIVAGFAASVSARSPLIARLRDAAVQSSDPTAIRKLAAERSVLAEGGLDPHAGLPLPGARRLRLRPLAGDARLRAARGAEATLRRHVRAHAVDVPGPRHRLRALRGPRLVRPAPEGQRARRREAEGDDRRAERRQAVVRERPSRRPAASSSSQAARRSAAADSCRVAPRRSGRRSRAGAAARQPSRCRA